METIFTTDARDHCMLEVMTDYFKLSHDHVFNEINGMFRQVVEVLKTKKVNYSELKGCLTPNPDRYEIVLVFDTNQIESSFYGYEVFQELIPLFDRRSSYSVLCGDYIDRINNQEKLYQELVSSITLLKGCDYVHSSQFYFVYLNNISNEILKNFNEGLREYAPYIGFIDVSYSSFMKTYVSVTLCNDFIKNKNTIIMGHEDDRDESENVNMCGYPFEENGYRCVSLSSSLFGVFLSYKIERQVYTDFSRDTEFAINSISKNVLAIEDFSIHIDDKKLTYLIENKTGKLKKAGLIHFTTEELEDLIRQKISSNYIYNLTHIKKHSTTKFNIIIEKYVEDTDEIVKLTVALEYMPSSKVLRLITIF